VCRTAGVAVPAEVIGLPTTGGEVTDAAVVAPSGTGASSVGEHCR
jgi:feruloyl esterase